MKIEFRKVDGVLVFDADGTAEELATFAIIAGFSVSQGIGFIRGPMGPKGDKGDAGPAGPQGPTGAPYQPSIGWPVVPSIVIGGTGADCGCGPNTICCNSACPRRMTVTCSTVSGTAAAGIEGAKGPLGDYVRGVTAASGSRDCACAPGTTCTANRACPRLHPAT